jgi:hypothetical protein
MAQTIRVLMLQQQLRNSPTEDGYPGFSRKQFAGPKDPPTKQFCRIKEQQALGVCHCYSAARGPAGAHHGLGSQNVLLLRQFASAYLITSRAKDTRRATQAAAKCAAR